MWGSLTGRVGRGEEVVELELGEEEEEEESTGG